MYKTHGFTLIELLIVVAIIAILAAIAIPNFLAAQVRSKVARVRAELQTMATAVESYAVDNNYYPLTTPYPNDPIPNDPQGILPITISTPIAYIANARPLDPFKQPGTVADEAVYTYHNLIWDDYTADYLETYGDWRMCSIGPDGSYWNNATDDPSINPCDHVIEYDPSNGTISFGNIWRSQKHSDPYEWRPVGCP